RVRQNDDERHRAGDRGAREWGDALGHHGGQRGQRGGNLQRSLDPGGEGRVHAHYLIRHLTGATSASFAIAPAAPAKVAFTVQPSTADVAQPITPAIQVAIQDAFANTVTSATNGVTLALATNPGSGTLAGTKTGNAVGGLATFSGLSIDKAGTGYAFAATSLTLTGATSAAFDI